MHWLDMGTEAGPGPDAPDPARSRPLARFRDAVWRHKTALIAAALAAPLAVALFFLAAPREFRAQALLAAPDAGAAQLIGSASFGRRAIKDLDLDARPEFDLGAKETSPIARALVFLGLAPDLARVSQDERVLKAFEERLGLSATGAGLAIAFRSQDPAFAAAAANCIAALYLDMRGQPGAAGGDAVAARMISPAVLPTRPLPPAGRLLFAIGAGAAAVAALASGALRRPARAREEPPMEPPRAVGEAPALVRLRDPARPLSEAGRSAAAQRHADEAADLLDGIVARITAARGDGRALRIVGAGLCEGVAASAPMLTLARTLGAEGRSILLWLDDPPALRGSPGVRDLIDATASFDEAIRRDPRSRLHLINAGPRASSDETAAEPPPIEADELGGVLDALARTYDFIWLLAPALDAGDLAQALAAEADFFVLAAPPTPQGGAIARAETLLRASGAGEILIIGAAAPAARGLGRDAA